MTSTLVADSEYANLRGAYGYLGVDPLTAQQELMLLTHLRGVSVASAARAAGMTPSTAYSLMKEDRIEVIKDFFRQQLFDHARVDLNMLTNMALEAHRKSANATEELKAVETIAKLNQVGGFAPAQTLKDRAEDKDEKDITPKSAKELEQMPEDRLLKLANFDQLDGGLDPTPVAPRQKEEGDVLEGEIVDD